MVDKSRRGFSSIRRTRRKTVSDLACSISSGKRFPLKEKNATSEAEKSAENTRPAIIMTPKIATAPQSTLSGPMPGNAIVDSVI